LSKALASGKFIPVDSITQFENVDICIICVPTPVDENHEPDLSFVVSAARSVAPVLKSACVLVNESTSYPGTLRNVIRPEILSRRSDKGDIAGYVAAPERVDPMNSNYDHSNTPRVLGGDDPVQVDRVKSFYSSLGPEVTTASSPETAELSKLIENAFRLVNISFVNELVPYSHSLGINLLEALEVASTKPFGFMKFTPGPGIGGHCIPVDPQYLSKSAKDFGINLNILNSSLQVNAEVPKKVTERILELTQLPDGSKILLIGVAYKNGISDTRETPALEIANQLTSAGHYVYWIDSRVSDWDVFPKYQSGNLDLAIALTAATRDLVISFAPHVKVIDCTGRYDDIDNVISFFKL
jgi:UDP-N-acetyl-D-glucosamine dehydrogenase